MGNIYIVGFSRNPVKVGKALNVKKRLSSLQTASPDPLIIHHVVMVPSRDMHGIEQDAHSRLMAHHRRGEWFNVDADHALEAVRQSIYAANPNYRRRGVADELSRVAMHHKLDDAVREAVDWYRETVANREDVSRVERVIRDLAGWEAWRAAAQVICHVDHAAAPIRYPVQAAAQIEAAANGLNALADFYRFERENKLLDEIRGMVA